MDSFICPALSDSQFKAINGLRTHFAAIADSRVPGRTLHRLDEVLVVALCAILADQQGFTDIALFARSQLGWLRGFLPLLNGAPSHDVFRHVFMLLKPAAFIGIFTQWAADLSGKQVSIDGKVLRGAIDSETGLAAVHVLRAWVNEAGLSAGHLRCKEKSNERAALPRLLSSLQLQGAVVTIDAMAGHRQVAQQLHESGADWLLALKKNEKHTFLAVAGEFASIEQTLEAGQQLKASCLHESVELSHGRFERRETMVCDDLGWFDKSWKWPGIQSVIRVRRWTQRGSQKDTAVIPEVHYYLSSLPPDARRLGDHIRRHWGVENSCHHVLDVTFNEDHNQVRDRQGAHNVSILCEVAAKVLKEHPAKLSLRAKRKLAAHDPAFRLELLAGITCLFDA